MQEKSIYGREYRRDEQKQTNNSRTEWINMKNSLRRKKSLTKTKILKISVSTTFSPTICAACKGLSVYVPISLSPTCSPTQSFEFTFSHIQIDLYVLAKCVDSLVYLAGPHWLSASFGFGSAGFGPVGSLAKMRRLILRVIRLIVGWLQAHSKYFCILLGHGPWATDCGQWTADSGLWESPKIMGHDY